MGPDRIDFAIGTLVDGLNWATLANTPFRRYKHFTHEGGISSPLIAHWPSGISKERRNALEKQPAHLVDIMATAIDLAGAKYPRELDGQKIEPMQGVSLRPALAGEALAWTEPIFWEHEGNKAVQMETGDAAPAAVAAFRHGGRPHRAARFGRPRRARTHCTSGNSLRSWSHVPAR